MTWPWHWRNYTLLLPVSDVQEVRKPLGKDFIIKQTWNTTLKCIDFTVFALPLGKSESVSMLLIEHISFDSIDQNIKFQEIQSSKWFLVGCYMLLVYSNVYFCLCSLQRFDQEWRTSGWGECGWSTQDWSPKAAMPDEPLTGPQHQSYGGQLQCYYDQTDKMKMNTCCCSFSSVCVICFYDFMFVTCLKKKFKAALRPCLINQCVPYVALTSTVLKTWSFKC